MGIALVHDCDPDSDCIWDINEAISQINHTGQEHCGIVVYGNRGFERISYHGNVAGLKIPSDMHGSYGVGNVGKASDHQPLIFYSSKLGNFALTFDGFICNKDELRADRTGFLSPHDAELAGRIITQESDFPSGIERLAEEIKGCYSLGIITEDGNSYVARCPLATKPLMLGQGKAGYAAVTESRAFRKFHMKPSTDIDAGQIIRLDQYGITPIKTVQGKQGRKICSFQWGYYAWVDSIIEGKPVSRVRENIGKLHAAKDKEDGITGDIVSAIEDSGKAYAEGYQHGSGIHYSSTEVKYPYFNRSYDTPSEDRSRTASRKHSSVDDRVKGKIIILNDDSLRRGTVHTGGPIEYLWNAGAKGIHMREGSPRNTHFCRLDNRDAADETLPANRYPTDEEMARFLNVNTVRFPTVDDYVHAIIDGTDLTRDDLCLGCFNGDFGFLE